MQSSFRFSLLLVLLSILGCSGVVDIRIQNATVGRTIDDHILVSFSLFNPSEEDDWKPYNPLCIQVEFLTPTTCAEGEPSPCYDRMAFTESCTERELEAGDSELHLAISKTPLAPRREGDLVRISFSGIGSGNTHARDTVEVPMP